MFVALYYTLDACGKFISFLIDQDSTPECIIRSLIWPRIRITEVNSFSLYGDWSSYLAIVNLYPIGIRTCSSLYVRWRRLLAETRTFFVTFTGHPVVWWLHVGPVLGGGGLSHRNLLTRTCSYMHFSTQFNWQQAINKLGPQQGAAKLQRIVSALILFTCRLRASVCEPWRRHLFSVCL